MNISVDSWFAWQPRPTQSAQCLAYQNGHIHKSEVDKPVLDEIPAMQRRRLGPLARVVFHALGHCADVDHQEPVVFSSLMGEIQRTQSILYSIASDQTVSPTAFSLSVHNAISGLWSQIHRIKAPMIALSPTNGSPIAALIEAAGILQENTYPVVNIVFYEEDYPPFYQPYLNGPSAPSALALRLVAPDLAGPNSLRLNLTSEAVPAQIEHTGGPLCMLPLLTGLQSSMLVTEPQSCWRLSIVS